MNELVFEVIREDDGGFVAERLGENIFTQGDTWEALRENVRAAVRCYFFDQPENLPARIRLHLVNSRLARECAKLSKNEEQALAAEERLCGDAWVE